MDKMQPKQKKIKTLEIPDEEEAEVVVQPASPDRDVAKEVLAHMDMLLLQKRVGALELADAKRDAPVGHVLKATPIIFKMVERLQEDVAKLRKEIQDQKDTSRFIAYFCRDIVRHLQDSGLPTHIRPPCVD